MICLRCKKEVVALWVCKSMPSQVWILSGALVVTHYSRVRVALEMDEMVIVINIFVIAIGQRVICMA